MKSKINKFQNKTTMSKKIYITEEQLYTIEHYKRMFEVNAENIEKLCNGEKADIVYGFELGKIHSHLRECFLNMMDLFDEIKEQKEK